MVVAVVEVVVVLVVVLELLSPNGFVEIMLCYISIGPGRSRLILSGTNILILPLILSILSTSFNFLTNKNAHFNLVDRTSQNLLLSGINQSPTTVLLLL